MRNENEVLYRARIKGTVVDNSRYGNMVLGDPYEIVTKAYKTPSAVKGAVTNARRTWPFNEHHLSWSSQRAVRFDSVTIEKATLVWEETTI